MVVMTENSISESEAEIARLEQEEAAATARAESLAAFAEFSTAQAERTQTVSTLAQSRFDWERVLRELAVVIPAGITLKDLTGTVNPAVSLENAGDVRLRAEIPGPALTMTGCAAGQEAVAALVAALEDIDGVTRVGLQSSKHEDPDSAGAVRRMFRRNELRARGRVRRGGRSHGGSAGRGAGAAGTPTTLGRTAATRRPSESTPTPTSTQGP